ncbi:hypothetical protein NP493_64g06063 [Ridgeia piscesae]|uniref:Uncharacterized protein n=1 Tax=Ridgeia piscesae TaxID=27915 RepID=A0AAD9PA64_RIDPI|nr:hypothetical protein NP493_64g06063 [Ridgeia piscesae]
MSPCEHNAGVSNRLLPPVQVVAPWRQLTVTSSSFYHKPTSVPQYIGLLSGANKCCPEIGSSTWGKRVPGSATRINTSPSKRIFYQGPIHVAAYLGFYQGSTNIWGISPTRHQHSVHWTTPYC